MAWLRPRPGSNALIQRVFDESSIARDDTLTLTTEVGLGLAPAAVVLGYLV